MMNRNLSNTTSCFPKEHPENLSSPSKTSKNPKTSKALDQKKDEYLTDIRSQKRDLYLNNKRLDNEQSDSKLQEEEVLGKGLSMKDFIADCLERKFTLKQVDELVNDLDSSSLYQKYFAAIGFSKLLTLDIEILNKRILDNFSEDPEGELTIATKIIPIFIELLQKEDDPQLQVQIFLALSEIASSQYGGQLADNGAIPVLIQLLRSQNKAIQAEALYILGNLAGLNAEYRDSILQGGAVDLMVEITEKAISEGDKKLIKQGNWGLASFWYRKPLVPYEKVKDAVPVLAKVIMNEEDEQVLTEAARAISCLNIGDPEQIQQILDTGVVPFLVKYLDRSKSAILMWCLRIIGNIFLGSQEQVDIKNYVATILTNLIKYGNQEQLKVLLKRDIIGHFGNLIGEGESFQENGLKGILEILNLEAWRVPEGFKKGVCWSLLEKSGKISIIKGLKKNKNKSVAQLACKILEEYK